MKFICQSSTGILTDETLSCSYQYIPLLFSKLTDYFIKQGISTKDIFVLECENSLPAALVLLYLLEHNISFLLSKAENNNQNLPDFCRYQLQINSGSLEPESFLKIIEHPVQNAKQTINKSFVYMRTSGSTGLPKIIAHSHEKLLSNITECVKRLRYDAETRMALPVPISHLFGLGAGFLPAILVGASIDLQKGANIIRYTQREKMFNPNTVLMTPIFCETLIKGRKTPSPYRLTVVAGDCLRNKTFVDYEALFGCLVQLYGSTEMGAIAAGNPLDNAEIRNQFIGLPMTDAFIKIDKSSAEINDGDEHSGEIFCRREYGFDACFNHQGESAHLAQIDADGWFATKDLGKVSESGYIKVLGRCDHSIKRDGLLVLFADIETALLSIEGIKAAAVIAYGESLRGKGLLAYCVIEDNNLTVSEIRSRCFDLLPKRAIPDKVVIINHLPVLDNGKIDRLSLLTMAKNTADLNLG